MEDSSTTVDDSWINVAATKLKEPLPKSFDMPPRKGVVERNMPKVYDPLQQTYQEIAKHAIDYSPLGTIADTIDAVENNDAAKGASAVAAIIPVPGAKLVPRIGSEMLNYARKIDDVPIGWLRKLYGNNLRYDPAKLADEIVKEGGLRSPLIINVGKESRTAQLGEGNHRLAALYRLGYDYAPARTVVGTRWGSGKPQMQGIADDIIPQPNQYFSADAMPSEVFRSLQKLGSQ